MWIEHNYNCTCLHTPGSSGTLYDEIFDLIKQLCHWSGVFNITDYDKQHPDEGSVSTLLDLVQVLMAL